MADNVALGPLNTANMQRASSDKSLAIKQVEKAFEADCSPDTPFKIEQGELFPENLLNDAELVENGRITDEGMALLKEKMPHVDFSEFESDRSVGKIPELFTVKTLVDFCERKLAVCAA